MQHHLRRVTLALLLSYIFAAGRCSGLAPEIAVDPLTVDAAALLLSDISIKGADIVDLNHESISLASYHSTVELYLRLFRVYYSF